jgi:hypothetical protein
MQADAETKLPTTNAGLYFYAQNFGSLITTGYASYGLTNAQQGAFNTLLATYQAAYVANEPNVRTPQTAAAFLVAKEAMLNYLRPLRQQISNQPETVVSRALKLGIRVNPHFNSKGVAGALAAPRTRVEVTAGSPQFSITPSGNLQIKIRYHSDGAPLRTRSVKVKSSAKPRGADIVQFYYKMRAPVPGGQYSDMLPMVSGKRSPFCFTFDGAYGGKTAYIACRYISPRGEVGDWSPLTPCTVPVVGAQVVGVQQ